MSMEIKTSYNGYNAGKNPTIKERAVKVSEKTPEVPGGQEQNRDTMIFGSSPYAKDNFSDYMANRLKSLAEKLPEMAKNAEPQEQITFSEWYGKGGITVSAESQKILDGVAARKEAQKAATEAMKAMEPENPFIETGAMLCVKDGETTKALPLLRELLKYGNEHSEVVILEGILNSKWYRPLFESAKNLYSNNIYAYYFDLPFEETLKRHNTKPNCKEFGEEAMRRWWIEKDYAEVLDEQIITQEKSLESIVSEIYAKATEQ